MEDKKIMVNKSKLKSIAKRIFNSFKELSEICEAGMPGYRMPHSNHKLHPKKEKEV